MLKYKNNKIYIVILSILNIIFILFIIINLILFLVKHLKNNNISSKLYNYNNSIEYKNNNNLNPILNIIIPIYNEEDNIINEQIGSILNSKFPLNSEKTVYMICDGDIKSFDNINNIMVKRKIFEINRKHNYLNTNNITENNEIYKNNIKNEVYYYD